MDMSGAALIRPSQIHHCVFGEWQGTLEVQECLERIFRLLQLDPSISLLQQEELDQIVCQGEAPTMWTHARHFPPTGEPTHASIPTSCGPWHNCARHFVTFSMCQNYWSIIDPLEDDLSGPPRMQFRLHRSLRESFTSHNLPTPPLPAYRKLPRIAIQRDAPQAPMVLWQNCDVYHTAPTSRGHTPSYSSIPVHCPLTYTSPAQSLSRMVDTGHPP